MTIIRYPLFIIRSKLAPLACLLVLAIALAGCSPHNNNELIIFAASSLTDAFTELAAAFEAENEGVTVTLNFAGSSQLAAQLREGAPADVFASANERQMGVVVENGRISPPTVQPFATNQLTLITPADNPAGIASLADLAQPNLLLLLAAPSVPVRGYADQAIGTLPVDAQAQLYANVVSEEENVRQVAAKIALGEAEAGIVYTSDITPDLAQQVQQIPIPPEQNVIAIYPIAPLADSDNPELAQQFINFIRSDTGQGVLVKWGLGRVRE